MTKNWTLQRPQHNQQIFDEAAEWLVDVREGDLDAAGQREFAGWLRRSPEHIKAYLEVAAFWADAPQLASKDEIDIEALIACAQADDNVVSLDDGAAVERRRRRQTQQELSGPSPATPPATQPAIWRPRRFALAAAAIAVLCLGLSAAFWFLGQRGQIYETAIGEQRSVTLADGSTIDLNARSRIRIRFTRQARDVDLLEGQALFTVARDPVRPFTVSSDSTRVRAIGTQFVVYRRKSGTTVTVLEGKVSVLPAAQMDASTVLEETQPKATGLRSSSTTRSPRQPVFLIAGEQVMLSALTPTAPRPADVATATAWTQRQIVFQGAPLTEVVEEFNRYNLRQMIIRDPDLANVRVSGIFSSTQPGSLLTFLREQVGLVVDEQEDTVDISRR